MTVTTPETTTARTDGMGARGLEWWREYCHPIDGDPAVRAQLRRCRSALDALSIPAAARLARRLGALRESGPHDDWKPAAALNLARVLAHVTAHDVDRRPMRAAGWKSFPRDRRESDGGEERPLLSEARFRRLLEVERGEEQVAAFTRLVALLDGTVNVAALADDFWRWNDRVKQRWAFDYYAAGIAAPADTTSAEETEA